ncbi:MAG: hypothetical protein ACI9A2_003215, partial [Halioglobus sp.]
MDDGHYAGGVVKVSEGKETSMTAATQLNARDLEQEIDWFAQIIDTCFALYFGHECPYKAISDLAPPDLGASESTYADFIRHYPLGFDERIAIVLALA